MKESIKHALALSETRERLNVITALPDADVTDTIRAEEGTLAAKLPALEQEYREALRSESEADTHVTAPDAETRERVRLVGRANVGAVIEAVLEHRSADGAEREAQQAFGLAANQIPFDMLRGPALETRAVTPAPTTVGAQQSEILQPVFALGVGAFLGIDRPTVDMGDAVYPVLTSRPTVGGPHADSTDVPDTTGAYDADLLGPQRLQASFTYRRVDAARFRGMDQSLRAALNSGLEEALDKELVVGAAGLLTGANLANHAAGAAVTAFADYLSAFCFARIDGRYASAQGDLRVVLGAATYAHAGGQYRSNNADYSALDALMSKTGGVRVSPHVPPVASSKQNSVIRLGARRDAVQPVWAGVTIIVDEYGDRAGAGEIEVTAVLLANTKILRAGGFWKQEVRHAA